MLQILAVLTGLSTGVALLVLAALPLTTEMAMHSGFVLMALALLLGILPGRGPRLAFVLLCTWVVFRYLFWRVGSLPLSQGEITATLAIILLLAEAYGGMMLLTGLFVNAYPLDRKPTPLPSDRSLWPTVDIYIPTYSEGLDVVRPTLLGALSVDYPADKLKVFILDDGYPRSINSATPPELALELADRAEALQALCSEFGATYLTRTDNRHAKSGNMNSAMLQTNGELLLILDADHIPTKDILQNMAGLFLKDPKLAFVQSPHNFLNGDPFEKNNDLLGAVPSENDMFYKVVQNGLDFWNTSFFCGSAALIRRSSVIDVGGFSADSITEDASTSVKMHAKGWNSAYISIPMVMGLQPESYAAFIVQRMRWAAGMVQIMVKQNPFFVRGLAPAQRIAYASVVLFWLFPFARLVFFLAPLPAVLFDIVIYPTGGELFLAYTAPYLIAVFASFHKLFGKVRKVLVSEMYETMQTPFLLPAIISAFLSPNKPTFKVTPKGEMFDKEHLSELHHPLTIATIFTLGTLAYGTFRLFSAEVMSLPLIFTLAWLGFNLILLMASLGAVVERPQMRRRPRVVLNLRADLQGADGLPTKPVILKDINEHSVLLLGKDLPTQPSYTILTKEGPVTGTPLLARQSPLQSGKLILMFDATNAEEQIRIIRLTYGDSGRWSAMIDQRRNQRSYLAAWLDSAVMGVRAMGRFVRQSSSGP